MAKKQSIETVIDKLNAPIDLGDLNNTELAKKFVAQDKAATMVMEHYQKKSGMDFQQYLKDKIVPMADEKLQRDLSEEIQEEKVLEQEKDAVKEVKKAGLGIDSKSLEEAEEKAKENGKKTGEIDLDAEVMKAVYMSMLEEYHALRVNLYEGQNGQIVAGDMTPGYKMGAKLVAYQNYLRKLDTQFRNKYGYFIAQDDEEIEAKEKSFARREARDQKLVNKKVDVRVEKVDELNNRIEYLADKMAQLSAEASSMEPQKFSEKMDALQSEYILAVAQLEDLNPSVTELKKQAKDVEIQEKFEDRILGTTYDKKHDRAIGDTKARTQEKANEEKAEKIQDKFNDDTEEFEKKNDDVAQDLVDDFKEGLRDGATREELEEMVEAAEIASGVSSSVKEVEEENITPNNDGVEKPQGVVINEDDSALVKQCKEAVESPEEVTKKDIAHIENGDLEKRVERVQEEINRE